MPKLHKNKNVHIISGKYKEKGKNTPFYVTDFLFKLEYILKFVCFFFLKILFIGGISEYTLTQKEVHLMISEPPAVYRGLAAR